MTIKDGRKVQPLFNLFEGDIFRFDDVYFILSEKIYPKNEIKAFCLDNYRLETFGSNIAVESYRNEDITIILK